MGNLESGRGERGGDKRIGGTKVEMGGREEGDQKKNGGTRGKDKSDRIAKRKD